MTRRGWRSPIRYKDAQAATSRSAASTSWGRRLSEDVAAADHVIFIDAHEQPAWPDLVVRPVDPAADYTPDSHSSGPEELLALAKALYHRQPKGTLVATRAFDTTFGAPLTARARELVAAARQAVLALLATQDPGTSVQS